MSEALNDDMAAPDLAVVPEAPCITLAAAPSPLSDRNDRHPTSTNIGVAARSKLRKLLNQHLADTFDLFSQTKQVHWNAKSVHFYQFHKLFDRLTKDLEEHANVIAKRIAALGGVAKGSVRAAAADSRIPELPSDLGDGKCTAGLVEERYAQLAHATRKAIAEAIRLGDVDTSNVFIRVARDLDQARWFLEAHLRP